jgi:gliding motility-associated-like protein
MDRTKLFIALLLSLASMDTLAQNLVPNPSFELRLGCPSSKGQMNKVAFWSAAMGSPDYFNPCSSSTLAQVPDNIFGSEHAATGEAYVGLDLVANQEFIQVKLNTPLVPRITYEVSFKYSLADDWGYGIDKLGLYFSKDEPPSGDSVRGRVPQLVTEDTLNNRDGWTEIRMEYTAKGGEQYVVFGNFNNPASAVIIQDSSGIPSCYAYLDDVVISSQRPCFFKLIDDTTICEGAELVLDATTVGASYLWQDSSTSRNYAVEEAGTYWVDVTIGDCSMRDTVHVSTLPSPVIGLGNDTTLCEGDTLLLRVLPDTTSCTWQDSSMASSFTVRQEGEYWVHASLGSCSAADTIQVDYLPLPILALGGDTTLCHDDTLVLDFAHLNGSYVWQDSSTDPSFTTAQEGDYWVAVTVDGCTVLDSIHVNRSPLMPIDLGRDSTICYGDSVLLDVTTDDASYMWNDLTTAPTYSITEAGLYWVEVQVEDCTVLDSIVVSRLICEAILDIPNIFTPNQDGVNDLFTPIESVGIVSMETKIYNRWGQLVFETDRPTIEWDGQGHVNGSYFWQIRYIDIYANQRNLKGYVHLIR